MDSDNNTADVMLSYNSGSRYVFSDIRFPETVVDAELLVRLNPIKRGTPYLASKVLTLRNNLVNSGYFSSVSVTPLVEQRGNGEIDLAVKLQPEAQHHYSATNRKVPVS